MIVQGHVDEALIRATRAMRAGLGDPLTLDDLAAAAMFSKFHFSRIFLAGTGVSPGRFLAALRLQRAKELLLTTDLNVVDVGMRVGYSSVGTFSTRFRCGVGLSPSEYRARLGFVPYGPACRPARPAGVGSVRGWLAQPEGEPQRPVFVCLYPSRLPEGRPISGTILFGPGPFTLRTSYEGDCHLVAFSSMTGHRHALADERSRWVGALRLSGLTPCRDVSDLHVTVRPQNDLDPPVVSAMPDVSRLVARSALGRATADIPPRVLSNSWLRQ
jgi:AraC-like DNA-binding protein